MANKRKHRSTNEYLKYLKGELTPEQRYSFERGLEADPFEMEAMEGMENLSESELEEDLLTLHGNLRKRLSRKRRRTWYYAAATIASLLIVGTVFLNIYENDPRTASESIAADESFLREEVIPESEVSEDKVLQRDKPEMEIRERDTPEREVQEMGITALDEDVVEEDILETEPEEFIEVEIGEMEVGEVVEAAMAAEPIDAEAPAPVAGEVVALEAQPKRSRKKERAMEAPVEAPKEASDRYISGRVSGIVLSAEDMEPLPGASLVVKGSDSGMVSDRNGRFAFVNDKQEPATVIASYVGMETEEYQLTGISDNRLVMQPDLATLNEVLVVGYDEGVVVYPTGAVQKIKLDQEEFIYKGARPEGGLDAFKMYIEEQIRFPAGDTLSKREVVVLKFNVARDGSISNIQSLRSPGILYTEEAIRLLQEGPAWNPAQNESGATEDVVRMRILFKR
jgi:hypothetical protein